MKQVRYILATLAGLSLGAQRVPTEAEVRFFENRIRPLLANNCFSCHGPTKQRSDLRLDSAEAFRKGGSSGQALVSAQPEQSLLIRAVRQVDDVAPMPPKGKLKDQQIADLVQWVKMGAPYPRAAARSGFAGKHWAFQPPVDPPVPVVKDAAWPRSPLDHFVLAALETKGLRPAPPADRRTLLRRVTFDLTGLPPTPEEIDAFLADQAPDAFVRVVDRLLASPAYGERWGRHWLDVARYADSNGLDENIAHGNAWRYRDHIVAAFNRDQPYDALVKEQIAGDLLPSTDPTTRRERLIATGFLSLGPKVLAEVDERKMELDIVDEQVDTLGRAFLGMTVGCARCHDHKFDPVSLEDYHGLAGVFLSTKTMESFRKVARWHENPIGSPEELKRKAEHDARVAAMKATINALDKKAPELSQRRAELAALEKSAPVLSAAMGVSEGTVTEGSLLRRGNHLNPGKAVPRRFLTVLAGQKQPPLPAKQSGRLELAGWLVQKDNPLTARVMVNRVWRWHFGQGLVRSVDNFGLLGEKPTHPQLLDWLAHRFVGQAFQPDAGNGQAFQPDAGNGQAGKPDLRGWSLKSLHRLIVLSSTYQMGSGHDAESARIDPDNRLLWRMPLRRLEAEAIRDSLLAVSGGLDRTMGGSLLHVKNREYLFDHTSLDRTTYDSPRRSLYLPVIRNNLYDVFGLFDTTDATVSSGDRATTTVPTQALFLMNSDLVFQAAERLAGGLLARTDLDDAGRCRLLYVTAYGRLPTPRETERAVAAVAGFEEAFRSRARAWASLAHVVLAANEFVYVQ